jgi:hypothetical protein
MPVSLLITLLGLAFSAASLPAAFLVSLFTTCALAFTGCALQVVAYLVWRRSERGQWRGDVK